MGLSTAGAATVFFVGAIVMATILYGAIDTSINALLDANNSMVEKNNNELDSKISIVRCTYDPETGVLSAMVENTGTVTIPLSGLTIMVNGTIYPASNTSVEVAGNKGLTSLPPSYSCYMNISRAALPFERETSGFHTTYDSGLNGPVDVCVGGQDKIYLLDGGAVKVFSRDGDYLSDIEDNLHNPENITSCGGGLYVLDDYGIEVFDNDGNYAGRITTNMTGAAPQNIYAYSGKIYMANGTGGVVVMDTTGSYEFTIRENISNATDVFADSSRIYVVDNSSEIDMFNIFGKYIGTVTDVHLSSPVSISGDRRGDSAYSYLYVSNASGDIVVLNKSGEYIKTLSGGLGTSVWGLDSAESLFAADHDNGLVKIDRGCRVWVFGPYGESDFTEV